MDYSWCVDDADLRQVMLWNGKQVVPGVVQSYQADVNGDGVINMVDVGIVKAHLYEGCLNPPTCSDNTKNGDETDVDCGGDRCTGCANGKSCSDMYDCLGFSCVSNICQAVSSLTASLTVTSTWRTGYCVTVDAKNNGSLPTKSWKVGLNLNGGTIYTSWNGSFTGSSGSINVTPCCSWNSVIQPGQVNNQAGFCVNYGGGSKATVTSAVGTY
jgi:hypothetical protein